MKHCIISFVDLGGIRHSVEVQAGSMYEAAAAALEAFRQQECPPAIGSELDVQVRTAVTHSISIKKLKDWAAHGGASPREAILRRRIQAAFGGAETARGK